MARAAKTRCVEAFAKVKDPNASGIRGTHIELLARTWDPDTTTGTAMTNASLERSPLWTRSCPSVQARRGPPSRFVHWSQKIFGGVWFRVPELGRCAFPEILSGVWRSVIRSGDWERSQAGSHQTHVATRSLRKTSFEGVGVGSVGISGPSKCDPRAFPRCHLVVKIPFGGSWECFLLGVFEHQASMEGVSI